MPVTTDPRQKPAFFPSCSERCKSPTRLEGKTVAVLDVEEATGRPRLVVVVPDAPKMRNGLIVGNNPINLWDPYGLINWGQVGQGTLTTIGGTLSMVGGAAATAGTSGVGGVLGVPAMLAGATAFGLGMATIVNGFVDNECPIGTPTGTIPQGPAELAGAFTGDPYMQNVGSAADSLSAIVLPPKVGAIPAAINTGLNPPNLNPDQTQQ